jgi:hypothetical protein
MNRILFCATLSLTATPFVLQAGDAPAEPNRFSFGARFGMNFKASFKNTPSGGGLAVSPGPATGGADHTYDDGYVRVDSSGDLGGVTWNWGYQANSQVVGDTLQFHAVQPAPGSGGSQREVTDDPQLGVEFIYQRVIGSFSSAGNWGLEAGFGYTDLDIRSSASAGSVTMDAFPLNGVLPAGAGYSGTFAGPGAVIGDTPTRTISALTSRQKLSGQIFSIRLGPFAEWNLTPKLSLGASAGLTIAPASVDYDFSDSTGGTTVKGHSSKSDVLYGPYVSGMLRYDFTQRWGAYVGAQFQSLSDLDQSIGGRTARLDQGATIYGTVGITFRF